MNEQIYCKVPRGMAGGGGGLYVDDQRIFLGLKFMIPGFFWVGKFGKYFFLCVCGLI